MFDNLSNSQIMTIMFVAFVLLMVQMVFFSVVGFDYGSQVYFTEGGVECHLVQAFPRSFGRATYDLTDCVDGREYLNQLSYSVEEKVGGSE